MAKQITLYSHHEHRNCATDETIDLAYDWLCQQRREFSSNSDVWALRYHGEAKNYSFVIRTDVKSYYASINHHQVYTQLEKRIDDKAVLCLLWQYLKHTTTYGGLYWENERDISLGCPLSPWIVALYLIELDQAMASLPVVYRRFMDDWVILAKTRWQLKKAIRIMNQILNRLKLEKHPDKTSIGRTQQGFQFLGYWINQEKLTIAKTTVENANQKAARLYEQGASPERIGEYWRHWWGWAKGGLEGVMPSSLLYAYQVAANTHGFMG